MGAISATTLLLTQVDKIVLSRVLSLELFGYYSLAAVASNTLYVLVTPVATAVFPGLTREAASGNSTGVAALYHRATQTVAVLVLPLEPRSRSLRPRFSASGPGIPVPPPCPARCSRCWSQGPL